MEEEDLGFLTQEEMEERATAKAKAEEPEPAPEPVPRKVWKGVVAYSVGDFFDQYDKLRAIGYKRPEHFSTQFISGSRIGYWSIEMEFDPAQLTLEDLETMNWGAIKALGATLGVTSKNKKGLMYAICEKLGVSQQVL